MPVDFGHATGYDEVSDESVQSPTLHTELGIDRNELIRRLKRNIQSGQQDTFPYPTLWQPANERHPTPKDGAFNEKDDDKGNRTPSPTFSLLPSATVSRSTTPPQPPNRPLQFGVFTDPSTLQTHQRSGSPHPYSRTPPASPILSLSSPQHLPKGYDPTRTPSSSSRRTPSFSSPLARPTILESTLSPVSEPIDISRPATPLQTPHRPIKSYGALQHFPHDTPHSRTRSRRMSSVGTTSELFGSFVGSFEESILNGRMSTTPSKPVPFIAQIGVLSMHSSTPTRLRCPPHLTVPFPAFFYSVQDYDSPSPYVGQLDISSASKQSSSNKTSSTSGVDGYRIPGKGQLQIIIKNPNKTAIKLFLIPYDLTTMPPRTKTFLRQKSYVDNTPDRTSHLRYAVHIQIVSPSRNKFFVVGTVRVVFANRVSDGSERLRVETLGPEELGMGDKYSRWEFTDGHSASRKVSSTGAQEWTGETLEREVMSQAAIARERERERGREKSRKKVMSPGIRRVTVGEERLVSGEKSPVPRRGEAVEQGLLAMKLRALKIDRDLDNENSV